MKRGRTTVACVLSGALLAPAVFAAANPQGNGYDAIAVSNPFRLKPIPPTPPIVTPEPPKPPMSKLILQGITDILGPKTAMLEVQPPNNAPKTHLTMAEGERLGDIEIVSIDVVAGVVQVMNQGIPERLDFSVAAKAVATSSPSAVIPSPVMPGASPVESLPAPVTVPRTTLPAGTRTIRTPGATSSSLTPMTPAALPSLTTSAPAPATAAKEAPLTAEEQIIHMEINRELTKQKVINGELPPIPPTSVTPPGAP